MNSVEERIAKLTGKDANAFERYDSKPLSSDEEKSLKKAKAVYLKYCKNRF